VPGRSLHGDPYEVAKALLALLAQAIGGPAETLEVHGELGQQMLEVALAGLLVAGPHPLHFRTVILQPRVNCC